MIYRMFDGRHIDLSKVASVGPIHKRVIKNRGGYFSAGKPSWFEVDVQLRDAPIRFEEERCDDRFIWLKRGQFDDMATEAEAFYEQSVKDFDAAHSDLLSAWQGLVEAA